MKAKELMIGDWVVDSNNTNKKVSCIDFQNVHLLDCDGVYPCAEYTRDIKPIPLTEEILKANGFDSTDVIWQYSKVYKMFFVHVSGGHMRGCRLMIKYVHELQHALRLCGLNELADNLKLE